ncbi:MAG: (2Fe-2S)-binding protein [Alphaproteobacteria bacterium]|jgi:isoquinoline 1-oxidoreductase subunit alpha|nr:(2Fe-2S)-binding protein [Alphaproteobacteria bacterium]
MALTLTVNGTSHTVDVESDTPLLWVIRDSIGLTGTKYGCGIAKCGACTVHIDGRAARSCTTKASAAVGKAITTIEGLSADSSHPIQVAWVEQDVPQCGYCQSGWIMSAAALLDKRANPSDFDIDSEFADNICRCGTYQRIRSAIHRAAEIAAAR